MIALVLTGAVSGCASYQGNEKCRDSGCISDAQITSEVQARFAQQSELRGPDQLYVQTLNHVVYLSGTVETGLHRDIAASIAQEANGVTRVVNDISIDK
jgi:osmotically-inducible protein OsmY